MRIAAIIAEYNPFHNGHAYQIQTLRQQGFTHIVAVMSPDYVQRGEPAFTGKRVRTRAALQNGVDLVLELPLPYAVASAQRFAAGGVALVTAMGCVDYLAFGAETDNLSLLNQVALAVDSPDVERVLPLHLAEGRTFAQARQRALAFCCGSDAAAVLGSPNNILAVEYLRQLLHTGSGVLPLPLPRTSVGHDSPIPSAAFASATYLRKEASVAGLEGLLPFVPKSAASLYQSAQEEGLLPASLLCGERAVLTRLRTLPAESFSLLPDLSEGIENRLSAASRTACSVESLYAAIKTKRYTLARVRRLVLAAFLEIPGTLCWETPPYLRVLGFGPAGAEILTKMKQTALLPVSVSLADLARSSAKASRFARKEAAAADLYSLFLPSIQPCGLDFTTPVTKVGRDGTVPALPCSRQ